MPFRRVSVEEWGWWWAEKLEERRCHEPRAMRSGQSVGPIRMWVCDSCGVWEHSIGTLAPVCFGPLPPKEAA